MIVTGALSGEGPVDFYQRLATRYGAPVLELASGTGRIAIPIASRGMRIVGLDASWEMLSAADRKAVGAGDAITWVHGDMRSFEFGGLFQLIFVASNSFSHLYSREDIEGCLRCVRRHLAGSGRFVIEVFNPALGLFVRPPGERTFVATVQESSGAQISVSKSVRYDSATQISHEIWYFYNNVSSVECTVPLNLRMFFPQEIEALLHYNGFLIEEKYGDYDEQPFRNSSLKQIIVCVADQRS